MADAAGSRMSSNAAGSRISQASIGAGIAEQEIDSADGQSQRDPLFECEWPAERIRSIVLAQKFHAETDTPIEQRIESDDLAIAMRAAELDDEDCADNGFREGFVELCGVERNPE